MTSSVHAAHHVHDGDFVLGNSIGPFGRWVRLLGGIISLIVFVADPLILKPDLYSDPWAFIGKEALLLLAIGAIYVVSYFLLAERLVAKTHPGIGTMIFIGLPGIAWSMGYIPHDWGIALGLWVSIGFFFTFILKYGGCEVVALPTYLLGKRYTMYCPLNAMDAIENGVTAEKDSSGSFILSMISMTIALSVILFFSYVNGWFKRFGIDLGVDKVWGYLLVIPLAHIGFLAIKGFIKDGSLKNLLFGKYGIGTLALIIYLINYTKSDLMIGGIHWFIALVYIAFAWGILELIRGFLFAKKNPAEASAD